MTATFSVEDDIEGFVNEAGGGLSTRACGRGGGVSRGRIILELDAGLEGEMAGGGKLSPSFTSTKASDPLGGFGAGTFLETRRKTFGFPSDPTLPDPTKISDVDDSKVHAADASEGLGANACCGCSDDDKLPASVTVVVHDAMLSGLMMTFGAVFVDELLSRVSVSPVDNIAETISLFLQI